MSRDEIMGKINIHLTIDGEALDYCHEVNAQVRAITDSIIEFNNTSIMRPHITLLMGEFDKSNYRLDDLAKVVGELLSDVPPITTRVLPPYIEGSEGNMYILSDIDGGDIIFQLRQKLDTMLSDYLQNTAGSHGEYIPHLTLGHSESKKEQIDAYLRTVSAGFEFTSYSVEISDVEKKGTCINSLFTFDLTG